MHRVHRRTPHHPCMAGLVRHESTKEQRNALKPHGGAPPHARAQHHPCMAGWCDDRAKQKNKDQRSVNHQLLVRFKRVETARRCSPLTRAPNTTHACPGGWGMSEKEEQRSVLIKLNRPLAGHPAHQHRCLVRSFSAGWLNALSTGSLKPRPLLLFVETALSVEYCPR